MTSSPAFRSRTATSSIFHLRAVPVAGRGAAPAAEVNSPPAASPHTLRSIELAWPWWLTRSTNGMSIGPSLRRRSLSARVCTMQIAHRMSSSEFSGISRCSSATLRSTSADALAHAVPCVASISALSAALPLRTSCGQSGSAAT